MSGLTNYKTSTYSGTSQDLANIFASLTVNNSFTGSTTTFSGIVQSSSAIYCDTLRCLTFNMEVGTNITGVLNIGTVTAPTYITGSSVNAPTPSTSDNSTKVATTAFVHNVANSSKIYKGTSTVTGDGKGFGDFLSRSIIVPIDSAYPNPTFCIASAVGNYWHGGAVSFVVNGSNVTINLQIYPGSSGYGNGQTIYINYILM